MLSALALTLLAGPLSPQEVSAGQAADAEETEQAEQAPSREVVGVVPRVARLTRIPEIDGALEPGAWDAATVLHEFTEVEPVEGKQPDVRTEVRLMRDADTLYIGVICFEPEPEKMVLQNMIRDAVLRDDDRIEMLFDTFADHRTAFWFQISAAGARGDSLIGDNGRRFNKRWDAFWEGRTQIFGDRWVAELAIPFRTLAFGEDSVWRVNFERYRGADRSRARWAGARRSLRMITPSIAEPMGGFDELSQGLGLEFVPYLKVKRAEFADPEDIDLLGTGGGEINWRITPQLGSSITFNTDFAETEADERRVNLTRFPLFFPEKRDFFLQDSNLFEFGEQSGFGGRSNVVPYFSRRIGLSEDGDEVPIDVGARLAGRVGDMDLGFLAVRTGELESAGVADGELFVLRPSYRLNSDMAVGALFTSGNPEVDESNYVGGADFRYSSTDFLPGLFSFNTWFAASDDDATKTTGNAAGMQASLRTRDWEFGADFLSTQEDFEPGLGFVRRPGERRYSGEVRWEPRPENGSSIRKYTFGVEPSLWTDQTNSEQSRRFEVDFFGMEWHSGDQFRLEYSFNTDRLGDPFEPVDGSTIPAGFYEWHALEGRFEFSDARPVSGSVTVENGSWYNGDRLRFNGQVTVRPIPAFRMGVSYQENRVNLPGGDFATRVMIGNIDFSFSPDLSIQNLIQADNESDLLGLQSRLQWIPQDGSELFLVVNAGWHDEPSGPIVPVDRDITIKVLHSIRF